MQNKSYTLKAVGELLNLFKEATGINLRSGTDTGLTFDKDKKYISIGDTTLLEEAGVVYDELELKSNGFIIETVGNSIFIAGGAYGELYGAYKLLNIYFNFEVYASDEYYLDKGVTNRKFIDISAKDIPDIEWTLNPYSGDIAGNFRLKLQTVGEAYVATRGIAFHNILTGIIPYKIFGVDVNADYDEYGVPITATEKETILNHPMYATHPEWFNHPEWYVMEKEVTDWVLGNMTMIEPMQVNLTIAKDSLWSKDKIASVTDDDVNTSQQLLYDVLIYEMKEAYRKKTNGSNNMLFTLEDNEAWSEDSVSKANYEKYGTHTGEFIQCANHVAREIKKEFPEFNLVIFAYGVSRIPPVKLNDKGEYEPIDELVLLEDNIEVLNCYGYLNRWYDFDDVEKNAYVQEIEKQWTPLVHNRSTWLYSMIYYSHYFIPTSAINGMADTYSHLFENDYRLIFEEGGHTDKPRDWGVLKIYLTSQLRWDVYQNIEDLTEKFFKQYFKAAANDMLEFYRLEQNWLGVLNERHEGLGAFSQELMSISAHLKEESWPDNFLQQLLAKIDDAYKAIEVYKTTDPVLYTTLHNRINIESFTIRFLRAEIHGKYYGDLKHEWMASLYKDAKALGFKKFEGQVLLDEYFGKLA